MDCFDDYTFGGAIDNTLAGWTITRGTMLRILASRAAIQTTRFSGASLHHQSFRFLSKKPNKKGGSGGFSLRLVFSKYDLEDDLDPTDSGFEDEIIRMKNNTTLKELRDNLSESFGLDDDDFKTLEYLDNEQNWQPLTNPSDLNGRQLVPIRNPNTYDDQLYDDDDQGENYDDYDGDEHYGGRDNGDDDEDLGNAELGFIIREIVEDLYSEKYIHSAKTLQLKSSTGEVIATKDYVLKLANSDESLQAALLTQVGALDHIVQAIHFPFLWTDAAEKRVQNPNVDNES